MIEKIKKYFQGVASESRKIAWPSRRTIINHVLSVVGIVLITTVVFGAIDLGLSKILEKFVMER